MRKFTIADLKNKHFLALAGNGVLAVLGIVIMGLLFRSLDKSDVGSWFFFLTIYSLGDAIRNGFLQTGCIKFYTGTNEQQAAKVLGSVWYLALVMTGILLALNLGAFFFIHMITSSALVVSIQWFGFTYVSSLPFTIMFWILLADERYDKILVLRMVNSGSMIIYIIVLILLNKMTLQALLWCNFLTNCLTSVVGAFWGLSRFATIRKRSKETISELIHFGKYSFGSTVTSKLLSSTDSFIITFLMGPAVLAIYNLPLRLMEIVEIPLRTFISTGMSAMASAINNDRKDEVVKIVNKYSGMLTIAFIPLTIGALLLADLAIYLLGGSKYMGTEAANIYRIFMVLSLLYPVDRFSGLTLDIIHKPKINFYKVLIMLFFAIAGDFLGYAVFKNVYGIAFGSFLTVISGLLFAYYQLNKYLKFSIRDILVTGLTETRLLISNTLKSRN